MAPKEKGFQVSGVRCQWVEQTTKVQVEIVERIASGMMH